MCQCCLLQAVPAACGPQQQPQQLPGPEEEAGEEREPQAGHVRHARVGEQQPGAAEPAPAEAAVPAAAAAEPRLQPSVVAPADGAGAGGPKSSLHVPAAASAAATAADAAPQDVQAAVLPALEEPSFLRAGSHPETEAQAAMARVGELVRHLTGSSSEDEAAAAAAAAGPIQPQQEQQGQRQGQVRLLGCRAAGQPTLLASLGCALLPLLPGSMGHCTLVVPST